MAQRAPDTADAGERIEVNARPIRSLRAGAADRKRFGDLIFRGGLVLSSPAKEFGGVSGLHRTPDGRSLAAVTDRGFWLTADIAHDGQAPAGLRNASLSPILNASGRPIGKTRSYDTEALCIEAGVAYVGVERTHEVLRFEWSRRGTAARGQPMQLPPELRQLPRNRGVEALGVAPAGLAAAGGLVAISERSGADDEPTLGAIIGGPRPGLFRFQRRDGYDVTDLAFLPGGDMLVLERWYRPWRGVGMRIRRVPGASILPGATLEGRTIVDLDLAEEIDNMEALAVHREGSRTILTIMSDDNFSSLQRTLLLEFELAA
jgi:hypothetical protein